MVCKTKMTLWGKTRQGKQRFKCSHCSKTNIKKRPDQSLRRVDVLFERWLLETETLERISHHAKVTLSTTVRKFKSLWGISVPLLTYKGSGRVLIVDGIILERGVCILIAIDGDGAPITWMECIRENSASWIVLLTLVKNQGVPNPSIIVSDAQKGLLGGIKSVFPTIPHQRCMTHVVRLAQAWLTRNPKTVAGQELRAIINTLYGVTSKSEAMVFKQRFSIWLTTHHSFLKEKSTSSDTGRSWYTHRRLRGVRSLIVHAIPNLFTFLDIPETPRTNNKLEGGINSPIKALIRHHRGMTVQHRKVLVFRFLRKKQRGNTNTKC